MVDIYLLIMMYLLYPVSNAGTNVFVGRGNMTNFVIKTSFSYEECIVKNSDRSIFFTGKRQNNLYKIDLEDLSDQNVSCLVSIKGEQ